MTSAPQGGTLQPDELLARFLTVRAWVRSDRTVRQDAFIPPKDLNLSVTRHHDLSEPELWAVGKMVTETIAITRTASLHGRADLTVLQISERTLRTEPAPLPTNPNHAHVVGWPSEKAVQKSLAQQLAAASRYVPWPATA